MQITDEHLLNFRAHILDEEIAPSTASRYFGILVQFISWLNGRQLTKELLIEWREQIGKTPATVNVYIAAANKFLSFLGMEGLRLRQLRTQRAIYRKEEKELEQVDYEKLIRTAESRGKLRLAHAIETICALGIRVSELSAVTVESLRKMEIVIHNKGKVRSILLSAELVRKLRVYCKKHNIRDGCIFVTRTGKPLGRKQLWAEMKALCEAAGVAAGKVFPHNLRHLFALTHYRIHKDIVRLADLLGHNNVNTTRIYLRTSGAEQRRELEMLNLILTRPLLSPS